MIEIRDRSSGRPRGYAGPGLSPEFEFEVPYACRFLVVQGPARADASALNCTVHVHVHDIVLLVGLLRFTFFWRLNWLAS